MVPRVLIGGFYGAPNLGDEMILSVFVRWVREAGAEPVVISLDPEYTRATHGVQAVDFDELPEVADAAAGSDLFVLGGGGLFQDYHQLDASSLYRFPAGNVSQYAQFAFLAAQYGLPVAVLAQGVGPLRGVPARDVVSDLFSVAAHVSVRDPDSQALLREIGVDRDVLVAPDPAWCYQPRASDWTIADRFPSLRGKRVIAAVIREWSFDGSWEEPLAHALSSRLGRDDALLWIAFQRRPGDVSVANDEATIQRVSERIGHEITQVSWPDASLGEVSHLFDLPIAGVIAMRLHALLLALKVGIPVLSLEYDAKQRLLGEMAGVPMAARVPLQAIEARADSALEQLLETPWRVPAATVDKLAQGALAHRDLLCRAIDQSREATRRARWRSTGFDWLGAWRSRDIALRERTIARLSRELGDAATERNRLAGDLSTSLERAKALEASLRTSSSQASEGRKRIEVLEEALSTQSSAARVTEEKLFWASSELQGIKTSTGWALLQQLYRVRFAMFPRGSRREAAGKWLMRRGRALAALPRHRAPANAPDAGAARPQRRGTTVATSFEIVCLPSIEWDFRTQRPQQLARRFARNGHRVFFARHSFGATLSSRGVETNVEEIELPGTAGTNPYRDRLSEADAIRTADALLAHLVTQGCGRFVCIVQLPFWAGIAARLREVAGCDVVYDCMDLHAGFSSNTAEAIADEARLFAEADLVVCSSQQLLEHAAPHARRTALVRNGVDYDHFAAVPAHDVDRSGALTIGYYGAIADWFDSALVAEVTTLRPRWRFVLVGSTWSADTGPLEAVPNIDLIGEKPYAELPGLIADWDCCIIPFKHTALTAATNPVKVYEMLAAGKPVVSVTLPELAPMAEVGLLATAEGAAGFIAAIEAQVSSDGLGARAARRAYAAANTWEARAQAIAAAIDALQPQVSIVVVTFGNRELNELCLASLLSDTDYADFEVIVVDNASSDGTPQMLRALAEREPRLRIVLNDDNRGFAAANNQGAALARGRYLCFLNNDTVVHGRWLATLIGHLRRHAHLGLVGPVTNAIGNEAKIPVGYEDLSGMPAWADAHCTAHRGELSDISMLAFFCVALPRHVWHIVGPLDERFGTGMFEDDDYNRRVRAAGFDVKLAFDAFVHHWQMASFKLLGNEEYLRIYRENQAQYASKWVKPAPLIDPLAGLRRRAAMAPGTVIFAPSVGWTIALAQRPHHFARVLAQDGYVVVFDCSNAADEFDTLREVEPRLFLYRGEPEALAGLPRVTLWTFSYNYDYRAAFPPQTLVVYDWIDDLSVFPYDARKLASMHARALREATVVIAVARRLHEQAALQRPDARYVPNAVEEGRFEREPDPNPALVDPAFAQVLAAGNPIVGYYGALANWFDYELLTRTAELRPDWSFVLIGPDHDGSLARAKLERLRNIHSLGPRSYTTLPGFLHRFDVAMIPFVINEITLATSPLKLFEYFAAGRPVISTPMPECAAFPEVHVVRDAAEFAASLDTARSGGRDPLVVGRLRALAARNTWRIRAREAMQLIEARSAEPPAAPTMASPHP